QSRPRRQRARIYSFPDGLETIPRALAAALPPGAVQLNARVTCLTPPAAPGEPWQVTWQTPGGAGVPPAEGGQESAPFTQGNASASAILLALPAAALATLRIGDAHPFAALAAVEYPPVASLFLGYKREQIRHPLDGFGMLAPSGEHRNLLGVLFNSTLFPGRAPGGHVALTVLAGGVRHPELALLPRESLMGLIRAELLELLGISGDPVYVRHHVNPAAIPQYNLGYDTHLATLAAAETRYPGLHVGGPVRDGIAVAACIASGEKLARGATTV
ncbi:protoporphyrinogen/coproporphyrinogen oxidase, partial [Geminisphaera colitermitum]|uniref:protoporphyrinogen/coproporphyrinogen oxidase n=1 Tax=Geminisphaera colitermitum TaxID=1148786 RepID=UPI0005B9BD7F